MNCDQVFHVLTRGPFPSGAAEDVLVEDHLDRCPSCWRIAEALRPAGDMFEESLPPAECRRLPGYWGDSTPRVAVDKAASKASVGGRPQGAVVERWPAQAPGPAVQPTPTLAPVATTPNWTCLLLAVSGLALVGWLASSFGWAVS